MNKKTEERRWMEFRATSDNEMTIEGYAITFNRPATYKEGDSFFTEVIKKGALDGTDMKDVPMRYNHNEGRMIMARTRNKSLVLEVDDIGLKVKANLIDTGENKDIFKAIKEGLIDKMSFAFSVPDGGSSWIFDDDDATREITKIERLYDVSVVDTPVYESTSIYARSLELLESEKGRLESLEAKKLKLQIEIGGMNE